MGRTWVVGLVKEDVVWYQDFQGERSINDLYSVSWLAPLTRVAFSVGGSYLDSLTVDVTRQQDRFEFSPDRDADAQVGVRKFEPLSADLPGEVPNPKSPSP